jgi:xanthine dehydrogenase YagT iron-sulfur-binding subunit
MPEYASVTLRINGSEHALELDTRTSLLDLLRDRLSLTGTKRGCDHGQCGACTVLVEGLRVNACLVLAVTCEGASVTTVEGLAGDGDGARLQELFVAHDAFQCGFCTPGQLCSAWGLLAEVGAGWPSSVGHEGLTEHEIRERMSGNLCRCGAYPNIVAAIAEAAG